MKRELKPRGVVSDVSAELQNLQRQRSVILKSRNMQANRLQAIVAGTLGYASSMEEKDRAKKFIEATAVIKAVDEGADHQFASIIRTTLVGIQSFELLKKQLEKEMVKAAKTLPVKSWVELPEQRGFGLLFLAIVIGETGDLANYANPAKVWRRLGCAPYSFDGKNQMGSTWRSGKNGKLPAEAWEAFGYSPRRRSIAFLIGEGIVKQNFFVTGSGADGDTAVESEISNAGPYRSRYEETKAKIQAAHLDYSKLRCHRHGMLLATKMLLKNLWVSWNPGKGYAWASGDTSDETEDVLAAAH